MQSRISRGGYYRPVNVKRQACARPPFVLLLPPIDNRVKNVQRARRSFIFRASCSRCGTYNTQCALDTLVQLNPTMAWPRAVQFRVAYVSYTPSPPNYQRQYLNEEECHRVFSVTRHRLLLPFIDYLPSQDGSHAERVHECRARGHHTSGRPFRCTLCFATWEYENILVPVRY